MPLRILLPSPVCSVAPVHPSYYALLGFLGLTVNSPLDRIALSQPEHLVQYLEVSGYRMNEFCLRHLLRPLHICCTSHSIYLCQGLLASKSFYEVCPSCSPCRHPREDILTLTGVSKQHGATERDGERKSSYLCRPVPNHWLSKIRLRVRQKLSEDPDDRLLWEHSKQQCFPRLLAKRKRGWGWEWGLGVPFSEWKESLAPTQKVSFCISGSLKKTSCGHGAVGGHQTPSVYWWQGKKVTEVDWGLLKQPRQRKAKLLKTEALNDRPPVKGSPYW